MLTRTRITRWFWVIIMVLAALIAFPSLVYGLLGGGETGRWASMLTFLIGVAGLVLWALIRPRGNGTARRRP